MRPASLWSGRLAVLCVLSLDTSSRALAQSADTTSTSADSSGSPHNVLRRVTRDEAKLPVDRLADLLALEPGIVALDSGDVSVRGSGANALGLSIDGISFTPGHRRFGTALLGGSYLGADGSGIGVGTNGFETLSIAPGVGEAEFGGGRGGTLRLATRDPAIAARASGRRSTAGASWATDALLGKSNGLDFNRILLDGATSAGRFSVGAWAVLEGQGTARLGQEQNGSPVYVANGIDTTVTVTSGSGSTQVDVLRFSQAPGIRIPSSAVSSYQLLGRATYQLGQSSRFEFTALASQHQARAFDYFSLYNPQQLGATRRWSQAVTGGWAGRLLSRSGMTLGAEARLSWQRDQETDGPLTTDAEQGSRNPFGGLMIGGLGFRFDGGNFPVNQQLVNNFRLNSGRLSPYDINNPSQYSAVDTYRNNAYGVEGFEDGGGPDGRLTIGREQRVVGKLAGNLAIGTRQHLRAGVERTGYDVKFYSSGLTSQAFSDAYVESPTLLTLFGDYQLDLGEVGVSVGARYDRFHSGASRPDFPRISTLPGFNPANPTAGFVADQSHGRVSPSIRLTAQATPRLRLHAGLGARAQLPDFGALFSGLNTDLSITNTQQVFGTDLDFERSTLGEVGAAYSLGDRITVEADGWTRTDHGLTERRLIGEFDPQKLQNVDLFRYTSTGDANAQGLDVRVGHQLGATSRVWVSYSFQDATTKGQTASLTPTQTDIPRADARRHNLAMALLLQSGADDARLGGLLRDAGLYATVRVASGAAYTACPTSDPGSISVLSGEFCSRAIAGSINGHRLPLLALVDLRLTRGITLGAVHLVAFADARNLLNRGNITRVFTQTGTKSNPTERTLNRRQDVRGFADEGSRNGVLLADSTVDLTFGGAPDPRPGCALWLRSDGTSASPNCLYLLQAETRFGDGDHLFSPAEQLRASDALYNVLRGRQFFTGAPRRLRIGVEARF